MTTTETHEVTYVADPFTWGACEHPDAPILLGLGEERPESTTQVEVEPGVFVVVKYYSPDAAVEYVAQVACPVCGSRQVFRRDRPFEEVVEAPAPLPPVAIADLDDAVDVTPIPEEDA